MKRISMLVIAALALTGCAARRLPVTPTPPSPDSAVGHIAAHDEQLAAAQALRDELGTAVRIARDFSDQAWAAYLDCAHRQAVPVGQESGPICSAEAETWHKALREQNKLSDRQRGIVYYQCDPGWALIEKTCWAYLPSSDLPADVLAEGKACSTSLVKPGMILCQRPAKTEP